MVTISISTMDQGSHDPLNTIFFASEEEAKKWFEVQKSNTLNSFGVKTPEELKKTLANWPEDKNLPISKVCAPWKKVLSEGETGFHLLRAVKAYIDGKLQIHPMARLDINGEELELEVGNDMHKAFPKVKRAVEAKVLECLKKEIPVKTVVLDGKDLNFLYIPEQICSDEEEKGMLENFFPQYVERSCQVVRNAITLAAYSRIRERLERAENALKALKGAIDFL